MTSVMLTLLLLAQSPSEATEMVKTFYLSNNPTSERLSETVTAIRQRTGITKIATSTGLNAITVRDTSAKITQAERVIAEFGESRPGTAVAVDQAGVQDDAQIIKTFYLSDATTQRDLTEILTAVRTVLRARFLSLNTNARAIVIRDTWNQVALAAKVIADLDRSQPGEVGVPASAPIVVASTSGTGSTVGAGTESQIPLANIQTEIGVSEIVITLRTMLNLREVEGGTNAIVLRNAEDNLVVLAQKLVTDLDKPAKASGPIGK